jgi:hypothetical protein
MLMQNNSGTYCFFFFKKAARIVLLVCAMLFGIMKTGAQVSPPAAYSPGVKVNYVRMWEMRAPLQDANAPLTAEAKDAKQTTLYFDGLGRSLQMVIKKGSLVTNPSDPASSAAAVDMVSSVVYDAFGREQYKYLPFAANSTGGNTSISDGQFKMNPFQQQASFAAGQYPGESFFYAKVK